MNNIAKEARRILVDCLNGSADGALVVEGIVQSFGFSREKISEHKKEIRALLDSMPKEFHKDTGVGMSFLNLCMTKNGVQWGEHSDMEALVVLGIAAGMASYCLPRPMWSALPGGMPYVVIDTGVQS